MTAIFNARKPLKLLLLATSMMALVVWNCHSSNKIDNASKDLAQFSKDDPRLLLLESIQNYRKGVQYITGDFKKLQPVLQQMENEHKEEKKSLLTFLLLPILNNHTFTYLHNPENICANSTDLIIAVPSAPGNFYYRKNLRTSYKNFTSATENRAKIVFFIGLTPSNKTQDAIDKESKTLNDIVQESFEDIYHNVRYKAVSMLRWASTFCRQAKFVIRNDDDIIVNLTSVSKTLKLTSEKYSNFILGRVRVNDEPSRNSKGKSFLPKEEYPDSHFPPFALGGLLGYPILTVELLYQAALRVKPIWLDDVFITGICAPKVKAKLINDKAFSFIHRGKWAN